MFLLRRPGRAHIDEFIRACRRDTFSYSEVGATREGVVPAGYVSDHTRTRIGAGAVAFGRACRALARWEMLSTGWVEPFYPPSPIEPGTAVGILVNHLGFWSLNSSRVVYMLDERTGATHCRGFAYGTLSEHAECGEERFSVEWNHDDDAVWYDLFSFSRPRHPLARLGYPITRRLQKRFARDSHAVMSRASSLAGGANS